MTFDNTLKWKQKFILVSNLLFLVFFINGFCAGEWQPRDGLSSQTATAHTAARLISPTLLLPTWCRADIQKRSPVTKPWQQATRLLSSCESKLWYHIHMVIWKDWVLSGPTRSMNSSRVTRIFVYREFPPSAKWTQEKKSEEGNTPFLLPWECDFRRGSLMQQYSSKHSCTSPIPGIQLCIPTLHKVKPFLRIFFQNF